MALKIVYLEGHKFRAFESISSHTVLCQEFQSIEYPEVFYRSHFDPTQREVIKQIFKKSPDSLMGGFLIVNYDTISEAIKDSHETHRVGSTHGSQETISSKHRLRISETENSVENSKDPRVLVLGRKQERTRKLKISRRKIKRRKMGLLDF